MDDADNIVELMPKSRKGRPWSAERKAAMAKTKHYRPASGIPAGGEGWGGPAKGPGAKGDGAEKYRNLPPEVKELRKLTSEQRIETLKATLFDLALNAQNETTRLNATVAALNREEGMPVARQITADATGLEHWVLESFKQDKAG